MNIYAQTTIAGVIQAWSGAQLYGNSVGPNYYCSPALDTACYLTLNGKTNSSGNYLFVTDDLPDEWSIGALADSNCSTGATWTGELSPSGPQTLTCGSIASGVVTASPTSCTITTIVNNDGTTTNSNCPSSVTLKSPASSFPTGRAISYEAYDDAGKGYLSSSPTASSATTVQVPVPTEAGNSAMILRDSSNNNQVLGSALFTLYTKTVNSCNKGTNCGTSSNQ